MGHKAQFDDILKILGEGALSRLNDQERGKWHFGYKRLAVSPFRSCNMTNFGYDDWGLRPWMDEGDT